MRQSKHNFKRFEKGVSLVEVTVAMFIFSIMMTAMVAALVTLLHRRAEIRVMQQRTEELSLAINYMAKKIRTSDYVSSVNNCNAASCVVHEHTAADGIDATFSFSGSDLTEKIGSNTAVTIASGVTGGFSAVNTGTDQVSRITMHMADSSHPETSVQTTVSLRSNY